MSGIPWNEPITVRQGDGLLVWTRKAEPGLYYDGAGDPVSAEIARKAGFDVDAHLAEAKVQEELKAAEARIRRELALEQMRIRGKANPPFWAAHRTSGKYGVYAGDSEQKQLVSRGEDLDRAGAEAIAHAMNERYYMTQVGYTKEEIDAVLAPEQAASGDGEKGSAAA